MSQLTSYKHFKIDPQQQTINLEIDFQIFSLQNMTKFILKPRSLVLKRVDKEKYQSLFNHARKTSI